MSSPQQLRVPTAIVQALSRFQNSLDPEELKIFSNVTTGDDVKELIETLEADQGSRGCLRNMNRVKRFIDGLSQYARVIEVFMQVNPQILSFIWGPIKLLLQLSSKFTESFDRLLDACQTIGDNLPRFIRFAGIFEYTERIQNVIALLYEDILDFYRRTLKLFRRRAWQMFFCLAWRDFQSRFGHIVNNIKRHQQLIDSEACAEDIDQAHRARELAREQLEESLRQAQMRRKKECSEWLSPADVETVKDTASQAKTPGTTEWLLRTCELRDWINGSQAVRAIWLSGIPGAGKTVLSSSVVEHLHTIREASQSTISSVLYFFCSYKQPDKNTCLAMLRSFIYQIILQDEQLISYVYEQYTSSPHSITVVMCKKMLSYLLESCVPSGTSKVFLVIDGLDELPEAERGEFLPIMKQMLTKEPYDTVLRVFIASQDLPDISKAISRKSSRLSVGNNNQQDIRKYIESATKDLVEELGLDEEDPRMGKKIIDSLTERAGGMFLWVRLVVKGLLSSATSEEINNTLENLPDGLEQTYERILDRIRSLSQGERTLALKLLQWITCSTRIMTLRELQDAVGIQSGDLTVDKRYKPLPAKLRSVCGPIVEIVGEDTVVPVHFSAKEYLLSEHSGPFVDREIAHLEISIVFSIYMGFTCFDSDLCDEDVMRCVLNGDVRLLEYVLSSWVKHVLEAYRYSKDPSRLNILSNLLQQNVLKKHFTQAAQSVSPPQEGVLSVESTGTMPPEIKWALVKVLDYQEKLHQKLGCPEELDDWCDQNDPMDIGKARQRLYKVLEDLLEGVFEVNGEPDVIEKLHKLYGQKLFRCRHHACARSSEGFETTAQRNRHEDQHGRLYKCLAENCLYNEVGFTSKTSLQKHTRESHNTSVSRHRAVRKLEVLDSAIVDKGHRTRMQPSNQPLKQPQNVLVSDYPVESFVRGYSPQPQPTTLPGTQDQSLGSHQDGIVSLQDVLPSPVLLPAVSSTPIMLADLDPEYIPSSLKKEGSDWFALFNPKVPRQLDVDLVHTLDHHSVVCCVNNSHDGNCVNYSHDGKYLATGCNRSTQIFDTQTGHKVSVLQDDSVDRDGDLYIRSICFSPNGKYLITGAEDKLVKVWDIANHIIRQKFYGHEQEVSSVDISRDGRYLVSGSIDCTVRMWDMDSGQNRITLSVEDGVTCVAISPKGNLIAAGSLDKCIWVWDAFTGYLIKRINGHTDSIYSIAFALHSEHLLSASLDKTIRLWRLQEDIQPSVSNTTHADCVRTFEGHKDFVFTATFTADQRWIVSGSKDRSVQFWDPETGIAQFILQGHKNSVISVKTSPTGGLFATRSGMRTHIWRYGPYREPVS